MDQFLKFDLFELAKKDSRINDFILEGSLYGIWHWDLENPEKHWMHPKLGYILEYNKEEIQKNNSWRNIINQNDLKFAIDNFKHFQNSSLETYEQIVRYTHKNGSIVHLLTKGLRLKDDNGKFIGVIGILNNVTEIKKLEAEIKKKDDFWRETLEKMDFGFQIIDNEFKYIYLNKKTEEFSKYPPGSLIRKKMTEMYPNIETTDLFHAIKKVIEKKEIEITTNEFNFPNGEIGRFNNIIQPIEQGIAIFTHEVPLKIIMKNIELKEKKDQLYKLLQQVPGALYQYRLYPDGKDCYPYVSEKFWEILELQPYNIKESSTNIFKDIHPDDLERINASIQNSINNLSVFDIKYRVVLPTKGERWIQAISQPEKMEDGSILWSGYIKDITENHQAEQELENSILRWKFALEGANDGVWDWNLITNEVYFSPQWKAMLGFKDHEITGSLTEWSTRVHPDDLKTCLEDVNNHLESKTEIYSNIHRVLCKDGTYKWILDRGKVIEKNEKGKPIRMVGTHTDLTERKKIENILIEKNKELEQFAYISSHDLQEPLNTIISFSQLLKEENLSDIGQKSIEAIESSSRRMKEFIKSLLEYSKVGTHSKKTNIDIESLIENLKKDLSDLIQKKEATIQYIGQPIHINAYEQEIIKLFQNLIVNGIKYTSDETKPLIIIDSIEHKKNYQFSIKDNGIGIDSKQFDKIFEVFQRLHRRDQYEGTGIGLSYCKKVVNLHDGKIWLESEIGKGSTFYFTIAK